MNPLRRPRLCVRLLSIAALMLAVWLLLVPRTALYFVDDRGDPYDVRVLYSWSTSDQTLIFPSDLFDPVRDSGRPADLVTSYRVGCGTAFTSGNYEDKRPGSAVACSAVETPRRIIGLSLAALGVFGLLGASKLPRLRAPAESS